jgi:hypothetical protein
MEKGLDPFIPVNGCQEGIISLMVSTPLQLLDDEQF